jgi:hypothetical protein
MALSAFDEKNVSPAIDDLRSVLGRAYTPWAKLLALVAERIGPITEVWKFSGPSFGWGLRVVQKQRVILYMTPQSNQFLVSFALGEKAVASARAARLSASVLKQIEDAPRYAEGRGVRIPVRGESQLVAIARLAEIKWHS